MTAPVLAWLRSRRLLLAGGVWVLVAIVGIFGADESLRLPLFEQPIPLPVLAVLVCVMAVSVPLQDRFGLLEKTFARARLDRTLAATVTCGMSILSIYPSSLGHVEPFPWRLLLLLMGVSVVGVRLLGRAGWLPSLVAGLSAVYVDHNYQLSVSRTLSLVGLPVVAALLAVAVLNYVVRGVRTSL